MTNGDALDCTTDQLLSRLPEVYRAKLRGRLTDIVESGRRVRVYCCGVFDMFHCGHAQMLAQVKRVIPNVELVVGVVSDKDVLKGKCAFVMNETERLAAVRACRLTDEIHFPYFWDVSVEDLKSINCDFIAHDCLDYESPDHVDYFKHLKEAGYFIPTAKIGKISSTEIIARVLRHRDAHIADMLKHTTPADLNLGWLQCIKFGVRPANDCKANRCINTILDMPVIRSLCLPWIREQITKLLCGKKTHRKSV